jgi:hypothetical protein
MIEFTLFDYDNSEHWERFDEIVAKVGQVRRDGYPIVELNGNKRRNMADRATRLVVQFDSEDDAMFFKLKHL